jgi:FemAB-related protein (PEP-CTERM system-associated)
MTDINTAKSLIKKKILLSELEEEFSNQKREEIEQTIVVCQNYLKAIKSKIKEKSQITKKFKSKLAAADSEKLKTDVSAISNEIKLLENELKVHETRLYGILIETEFKKIPIQFKTQKAAHKITGEPTFCVIKSNGEWELEWNCFLAEFESHSTYHRPEWLHALSDYSNFKLFLFVLKIDNKVVAGVPMLFMQSYLFGRNMIALPYVNYGGILAYSNELTDRLVANLRSWAAGQKIDYFEFRTTTSGLNLPVKTEKCSMLLSLPSTDSELEEQLTAKVRAQYKKSFAYNPQVLFGGLELLDDFYKVFARNMRDLGTPVYSKAIFREILKRKETNSFLCIVKINNKPVSVAFLTGYRDMLEIPWASTLRSANKYDANMWMYRMILKRAIDLGYKYFDFGRSTIDANTYKFKKQWGAEPIQHHWYYLLESGPVPQTNPNNPKYRFLISVWKRLPVWLANIIGPHLVKNIP